MEVMWRLGSATVRDVAGALGRNSDLAYTTVMTVMSRLAEKGLLDRKAAGKAFVYRPTLSRERYQVDLARSRVRGLISDLGDVAISQFAEELDKVDPERARKLGEMLRKRGRK
jgi:predicted transcriptional regulator